MTEEILTQVGSTAAVVTVAAYFARTWIKHQLNSLSAKHSHALERQIAKLNVHEPYLHKRRVEIIEEIYKKAVTAEFSLQNFLVTWWGYSKKDGLPTNTFPEEGGFPNERGLEFCERITEINAMLHQNALYFNDAFIEGITNAYKPFFDEIVDLDVQNPPPFPEVYMDIIEVGRGPRHSIIALFRDALGVEG